MESFVHPSIQSFIDEKLVKNSDYIEGIRDFGIENAVPIIHRDVANFVSMIIKMKGVSSILEVGTAIGYSSLVFLEAMGYNGTVTTIERSPLMLERAKKNLTGYEDQITVIEGDALDVLEHLEGKFDLIFLDGAKSHYQTMINLARNNLNKGGIIISDNVLFKGMTASDDFVIRRKKTIVKNMRNYLDFLYEDRFETVLLPIGDGLAMTILKEDLNG